DQEPGCERNLQTPCFFDGLQAKRGRLVGRVVVRHAYLSQSLAGALQHEPHTRTDRAKCFQISSSHQPRISMRKQARFIQDSLAHLGKVRKSCTVSEPRERLSHLRKDSFGAVSEAEQRFLASEPPASLGYREDFVRRHGVSARIARVFAKRAIAAVVAAEICKRDEDFLRVRNPPALETISKFTGNKTQGIKLVTFAGVNERRSSLSRDISFLRRSKRFLKCYRRHRSYNVH